MSKSIYCKLKEDRPDKFPLTWYADLLNNVDNRRIFDNGVESSPYNRHNNTLRVKWMDEALESNLDDQAAYWLGRLKSNGFFDIE